MFWNFVLRVLANQGVLVPVVRFCVASACQGVSMVPAHYTCFGRESMRKNLQQTLIYLFLSLSLGTWHQRRTAGAVDQCVTTVLTDAVCYSGLRVSEELAPRGIRDEIIWSLYASLDQQLGHFMMEALEDNSSVTHLSGGSPT